MHESILTDREPERATVQISPPNRNGTTLHVVSQGAHVGCSYDSLVVRPRDQPESKHPIRGVDTLLLHGFAQVSTQALRKCVEHGVGVHWLTTSGYHTASLVPTAGQVQRRIRQYRALCDEATCLRLARALALAKVEGQHRYLLRASRGDAELRGRMVGALKGVNVELETLAHAADRDSLRGHEGSAAVSYFEGLRLLLGEQVSE